MLITQVWVVPQIVLLIGKQNTESKLPKFAPEQLNFDGQSSEAAHVVINSCSEKATYFLLTFVDLLAVPTPSGVRAHHRLDCREKTFEFCFTNQYVLSYFHFIFYDKEIFTLLLIE